MAAGTNIQRLEGVRAGGGKHVNKAYSIVNTKIYVHLPDNNVRDRVPSVNSKGPRWDQ
jgi:hypothetical protein